MRASVSAAWATTRVAPAARASRATARTAVEGGFRRARGLADEGEVRHHGAERLASETEPRRRRVALLELDPGLGESPAS